MTEEARSTPEGWLTWSTFIECVAVPGNPDNR